MSIPAPLIKNLGRVDYEPTWRAMERFTLERGPETPDEIWFLEHPPVFTLGLAGKMEHVLHPGTIPVVHIDRGGQVTYHGPGQLVVYPLLDLRRLGLGVRALVEALELCVVDTLAGYGVTAHGRRDAPGVYVEARKVCSIGIRVRRGCSYHGIALNVDMDLGPFTRINPCGYEGLEMTQLSTLGGPRDLAQVAQDLQPALLERLGYNSASAAA
ncbi:MAG TPA: lipoyl(octanoyl) transferase LipB [Gammaproteobacteria bacterium]|nr:lipoyl(octanoyl) transferase LipB [Gammaproteobacteria bacterium]